MQETRVQPVGQEDPLEEEMATLSSFFAREISWTEEPGGLQSMGSQRVKTQLIHFHFYFLSAFERIQKEIDKVMNLNFHFKS